MDLFQLIFWSPIAAILFAVVVFMWMRRGNRSASPSANSFVVTLAIWAITLGFVGLVSGSILPTFLDANPGNVQALVGIFFTSPFGIFLGVVLGTIIQGLKIRPSGRRWSLFGVASLYSISIVYLSVPHYSFSTYLVDGKIVACKDVQPLFQTRWDYWQKEHARLMRGETDLDRANADLIRQRGSDINWEQDVEMTTRARAGVILTVLVLRRASVYEAYWKTGHVSRRVEWEGKNNTEDFFSEQYGSSCEGYAIGHQAYYQSKREAWDRYPPRNLPEFLGLQVIKPAADTYRSLFQK